VARPPREPGAASTSSLGLGEANAQVLPTVPASGSKEAGVSFDDFFGSPVGGTGALGPAGTEPGNDDLDQFHSWLQNLKR
jgi:hypothetical protein